MREIKFRAWDGSLMFNVAQITFNDSTWSLDKGRGVSIPFQPSITLMQFTGLHDKNGKEIYEGDILIDKESDEFGNDISSELQVVFCQNTAQFCVDNSFKKDNSSLVNIVEYLGVENLEVIGNIYENKNYLTH